MLSFIASFSMLVKMHPNIIVAIGVHRFVMLYMFIYSLYIIDMIAPLPQTHTDLHIFTLRRLTSITRAYCRYWYDDISDYADG